MGVPGVTLPPDPIQATADLRRGAAGLRGAAARADPVRQRRRRQRAGRAGGGVRAGVLALPAARHHRALVVPRPRRHARDRRAPPKRRGRVHVGPGARGPPTDFTGNTGSGGLWTATPAYNWAQNPAGTAAVLRQRPAGAHDHGRRRRRGARVDQGLGAGRRPPGDDHRGPARRQGDLRAERLAAGRRPQARPRARARCSSRSRPCAQRDDRAAARATAGRRSRSRSTTRATCTGRARGSASTISAPGGDQPVWAFAEAQPKGTAKVAIARRRRPRGSCCRSCPASARRPPLPPCPGLRGEPCRAYQPLANAPAS